MSEAESLVPPSVLAVGTSHVEAEKMARAADEVAAERARLRERDVVDDLDDVADGSLEMSKKDDDRGLVFGTGLSDIDPVDGQETGFGRLETLPGFGDADVAEDILRRLARDAGVRACMRRRQWFVPTLAEMAPDGKVGVDPVCVLGLNEAKGQRILLRIRTDDLRGFRKFLSIKKVLFHELAHNERSQHDSVFYAMVSAIERECDAASEKFKAGGRRLGGAGRRRLPQPAPRQQPPEPPSQPAPRQPPEPPVPREEDAGPPAQRRIELPRASPSAPETDVVAAPTDFGLDPESREMKVLAASRELSTLPDEPSRREAATTLQIILANADQPDAKFHRIRLSNKRFLRTAGKFAASLRFLEAVGFARESLPGEAADTLVLRRHDPGLLWLGRSALESIVA